MPDGNIMFMKGVMRESAVQAFMRRTSPENLDATVAEHYERKGDDEMARIYRERANSYRENPGL